MPRARNARPSTSRAPRPDSVLLHTSETRRALPSSRSHAASRGMRTASPGPAWNIVPPAAARSAASAPTISASRAARASRRRHARPRRDRAEQREHVAFQRPLHLGAAVVAVEVYICSGRPSTPPAALISCTAISTPLRHASPARAPGPVSSIT